MSNASIRSKESSVRHLASFYTVIAGLAISNAVLNLINVDGNVTPFTWPTFILFVAFVVTLLPFYHGAMRHLDVTYVEERGSGVGKGALLADFVILFIEGCLFLTLAVLIKDPISFAFTLMVLLVVDTAWGFLAHLAFSTKKNGSAELTWTKINLFTICIMTAFFYFEGLFKTPPNVVHDIYFTTIVLFIALVRSIVDYWLAWHIYYPD